MEITVVMGILNIFRKKKVFRKSSQDSAIILVHSPFARYEQYNDVVHNPNLTRMEYAIGY